MCVHELPTKVGSFLFEKMEPILKNSKEILSLEELQQGDIVQFIHNGELISGLVRDMNGTIANAFSADQIGALLEFDATFQKWVCQDTFNLKEIIKFTF
jgi:hypothetical protein